MQQPFRIRAKDLIIKVITQRIYLIRTGKNHKPNADSLRQQCEILREQLCNLYSDAQLAHFTIQNYWKFEQAAKDDFKSQLIELLTEAETIV